MDHTITIDEQTRAGDYAARAFCSCGWASGAWRHADQMPAYHPEQDDEARTEAFDEADRDGLAHLDEDEDEDE